MTAQITQRDEKTSTARAFTITPRQAVKLVGWILIDFTVVAQLIIFIRVVWLAIYPHEMIIRYAVGLPGLVGLVMVLCAAFIYRRGDGPEIPFRQRVLLVSYWTKTRTVAVSAVAVAVLVCLSLILLPPGGR